MRGQKFDIIYDCSSPPCDQILINLSNIVYTLAVGGYRIGVYVKTISRFLSKKNHHLKHSSNFKMFCNRLKRQFRIKKGHKYQTKIY